MTDNQPIEELLEQGIQAAKNQDHDTARQLLEQVVEMDQHNEKGWFWLAAVIDDIDEKRICLNNVLMINPENHRAATLLEQLEQSEDDVAEEDDTSSLASAINREKPKKRDANPTALIAGTAAGVLLVVIVAALVFMGLSLIHI